MVIIVAYITAGFMNLAKDLCGRELSPVKLINYLLRGDILCKAMQTHKLEDLELKLTQDMKRRLLKNLRQRKTARQRLTDSSLYYEWCENS